MDNLDAQWEEGGQGTQNPEMKSMEQLSTKLYNSDLRNVVLPSLESPLNTFSSAVVQNTFYKQFSYQPQIYDSPLSASSRIPEYKDFAF
jgi:hypothetical protein